MPKLIHEALVQLLRAAPDLLVRLLPRSLRLDGPATALAQVTADELVDLHLAEYRSDVVVVLGDVDHPSAAFITEIQTGFDPRKQWHWPVQLGGVRARMRCPAAIVVFALDDEVAAAYRQLIDLGWGLASVTPIVIGAADIPVVTDFDEARACPELAVLSVMAHGDRPNAEHIALPALVASADLDSERQIFYPDFIYAALGPLARAALEHLMNATTKTHRFYSDFARKYYDEGEAQGELKGQVIGEAKGEAKGEARLLLRLLRVKGFTLTPEQQARVEGCTDTAQLETWADRLLTATTIADVFDPA